jgi:hypothetical protein
MKFGSNFEFCSNFNFCQNFDFLQNFIFHNSRICMNLSFYSNLKKNETEIEKNMLMGRPTFFNPGTRWCGDSPKRRYKRCRGAPALVSGRNEARGGDGLASAQNVTVRPVQQPTMVPRKMT